MIQAGNPSGFGGFTPPSPVQWGNHLFVDAKLGNDATGTRNDLVFKYNTHEGALADALPGDVIWHLNGKQTIIAGLWGGKERLRIYCEPGVSLEGTNLNQDIAAGCNLLGNAVVDDQGFFLDANLSGKGHLYFQMYYLSSKRWQCNAGADVEINCETDIAFLEYSHFYNSEYHLKVNANSLQFNNPVGAGFSTMIFESVPDSTVEINAPMFINGEYVRGLDIVGDNGDWETDLVYNGKVQAMPGSIVGESLVRSYGTGNYNPKDNTIRMQLPEYVYNSSGGTCRNYYASAGFMHIKGTTWKDNTTLPIIVADSDIPNYDIPSTILLDCSVYGDNNGGTWATDGMIALYANSGAISPFVAIDYLKIVNDGGHVDIGLQSDTPLSNFNLQGVQYGNVDLGANMVQVCVGQLWRNDPAITF